ncbi:MAG: ion transporter [Luminiphilus sp.]|jgi:voltage-gated potassium channel|nr:ion transporter [Luminiphilus sp.]
MTIRRTLEVIIFGTDTPAGRAFDIALLVLILASVLTVMIDSVPHINTAYGSSLWQLEIVFTALFTIEYLTRLWCTERRRAYFFSFWGMVDLLAILPTYIAFFSPQAGPLVVVRLLRMVRVFRILRLMTLFKELNEIVGVLRNTARSILVFLIIVMIVVIVFACVIYVIEGPANGFDSIPLSIYWAVVTITTVGYGDLVPQTAAGRFVAGFGMLVGYSIIAVPTAIITRELWERINERESPGATLPWSCPICENQGHSLDAMHCKHCGSALDVPRGIRERMKHDAG